MWVRKGEALDCAHDPPAGQNDRPEYYGFAVALSDDGSVIAVGLPLKKLGGKDKGQVGRGVNPFIPKAPPPHPPPIGPPCHPSSSLRARRAQCACVSVAPRPRCARSQLGITRCCTLLHMAPGTRLLVERGGGELDRHGQLARWHGQKRPVWLLGGAQR